MRNSSSRTWIVLAAACTALAACATDPVPEAESTASRNDRLYLTGSRLPVRDGTQGAQGDVKVMGPESLKSTGARPNPAPRQGAPR